MKQLITLIAMVACGAITGGQTVSAGELSPDSFENTHRLILPQKDESQWLRIPWLTDIRQAREQAAASGKPILIWSGGGSPPIGGC